MGVGRRAVLQALAAAATVPPCVEAAARPSANVPAHRRILIKGGYVASLDKSVGDLPVGDVLIDGAIDDAHGPCPLPRCADGGGLRLIRTTLYLHLAAPLSNLTQLDGKSSRCAVVIASRSTGRARSRSSLTSSPESRAASKISLRAGQLNSGKACDLRFRLKRRNEVHVIWQL